MQQRLEHQGLQVQLLPPLLKLWVLAPRSPMTLLLLRGKRRSKPFFSRYPPPLGHKLPPHGSEPWPAEATNTEPLVMWNSPSKQQRAWR